MEVKTMSLFVFQGNDSDCGFASLKMLLANLNHDRNYLHMPKGTKKGGYSFHHLMEIASEHGLDLVPYRYDNNEVTLKAPLLALFKGKHLVLIKSIKRGRYKIYDPAIGIYTLTKKEFEEQWSKETLEVNDFAPEKCERIRHNVMPISKSIISHLFSLLSIALLMVGFFFIKVDSYIFIPIIFITGFAISELVDNWYLIKEYNSFDKMYIDKYFSREISNLKSTYYDYIMFKKDYFSFGRKIYSAIAIITIFIFVLVLNDVMNSIVLLSLLLVLIIEQLLFANKDQKAINEINLKKEKLCKSDDYIESIKEINLLSNSYALRFSAIKCINTFIILIAAFTLMILTNNISVNFIIFHFGVYYVLFNNFEVMVNFSKNYRSYQKSKERFMDIVN